MRRSNAAISVVLALGLAALVGGCGDGDGTEVQITGDLPRGGSLLFVVRGDAEAEDGRLAIDADTVEWFSDRPERRAGVSKINRLVDRWSDFGFEKVPPNASVVGGPTETVVELSDPQLDEDSISFAYAPLEGEALEVGELGGVSVFIDTTTPPPLDEVVSPPMTIEPPSETFP